MTDAAALLLPAKSFSGRVHSGFARAFTAVWTQIQPLLRENRKPLFITGHSLGGALATLTAAKCHADNTPFVAAFTFGAPRVGDADFGRSVDGRRLFRVVNGRDLVPRVPLFLMEYRHVGGFAHILHTGILKFEPEDEDSPKLILLPVEELIDHVPLHYVQKLQRIVRAA